LFFWYWAKKEEDGEIAWTVEENMRKNFVFGFTEILRERRR